MPRTLIRPDELIRDRLQEHYDGHEFFCPTCMRHADLQVGFIREDPSKSDSPRYLYSNEECCSHLLPKARFVFDEAVKKIAAVRE